MAPWPLCLDSRSTSGSWPTLWETVGGSSNNYLLCLTAWGGGIWLAEGYSREGTIVGRMLLQMPSFKSSSAILKFLYQCVYWTSPSYLLLYCIGPANDFSSFSVIIWDLEWIRITVNIQMFSFVQFPPVARMSSSPNDLHLQHVKSQKGLVRWSRMRINSNLIWNTSFRICAWTTDLWQILFGQNERDVVE